MTSYTDQQAANLARQRAIEVERAANRVTFKDVTVPAIVAGLAALEPTKGWTLEANDPDRYRYNHSMLTADGERVWLSFDEPKNRITVHGSYPNHPNGRTWIPRDAIRDASSPSPSMNASKAPAAIVRDIARRFLPDYRALMAACRAQIAATTAYLDQGAASFAALVASSGGLLRVHGDAARDGEYRASFNATSHAGNIYGDVHVSGTSVRFERFSVTPAIARAILELIASRVAREAGTCEVCGEPAGAGAALCPVCDSAR